MFPANFRATLDEYENDQKARTSQTRPKRGYLCKYGTYGNGSPIKSLNWLLKCAEFYKGLKPVRRKRYFVSLD